ncbi:hypothetical protein EC973_000823 [Apophysomyces ossiformis]|uniref:Arrestin C-terminal-like domain-containing protein n=1 Tax=Apophysomyces ossiformis TaxID=679940 RepID=A0A8H7BQU1_9FUNG|nr:hypothetical protein EC973_000823 [Apophysomyces ossiformis]
MTNLVANASQVMSRHRANSSASILPIPGSPLHTNHINDYLSSSAPSVGSSIGLNERRISQSNVHLPEQTLTVLAIEFEGGAHVILRPNRVVRGKVVLDVVEKLYMTRIRIKFRAEEMAMVKVEEGSADGRGDWIHEALTTFFETEWKLWGNEASAKEWVYKTTLVRDKKQPLAEVQAKLTKQSYCPDEPFFMQLNMTVLHSEAKLTNVTFKFRKHHEGKLLVQQGTAFREYVRVVLQKTVPITGPDNSQISERVHFDVPTKLVSPSFASRHTRVYYDLQFLVTIEHGHLFKSTHTAEFSIPLTIANLPHDQLPRIPELLSIRNYRESNECPQFFDPSLTEPPPVPQGLPSQWIGPLTAALMGNTPQGGEEPPSYFSLSQLPPQFELCKERKERVVFLSRQAKGAYHAAELGEATIIPGLFDEDW